jgi:hypothetical protein
LLNRTSVIIGRYRPGLSFQPKVSIPQMRYMQVEIMRVKPGYAGQFADTWRAIVEAHEKAEMDEHWAVYSVESGMPAGTFLFFYPLRSLAQIGKAGPMHASDAFRDAVGEGGRVRLMEATRSAMDFSQSLLFRFSPRMSLLSQEFIGQDADLWTPKPPPAPAKKP